MPTNWAWTSHQISCIWIILNKNPFSHFNMRLNLNCFAYFVCLVCPCWLHVTILASNSHSHWGKRRQRWKTGSDPINIAVMVMSNPLQPVTRQQAVLPQSRCDSGRSTGCGKVAGKLDWVGAGLFGQVQPSSVQPVTLTHPDTPDTNCIAQIYRQRWAL